MSSSFGGFFGAYLKSQGIDALELTGVADDWVYLVIDGGSVRIEDARTLAGKSPTDVREIVQKKFEGNRVSVASIGKAGEKLVKYSIVQFGNRAAGRSGSGWHFGFKKIKAIVVTVGSLPVPAVNEKDLKAITSELRERKAKHELENNIDKYCSAPYVEYANEVQAFPASNYRRNFVTEKEMEGFSMELYQKKTIKSEACWNCPLACTRITKSRYSEEGVKGPEYETLWSLGAASDNFDLDVIIECNRLCDEYGLDTISTGNVLGWYKECVDEGLVEDKWSADRMFELIRLVGTREGLGDVLAEGVVRASEKLGIGQDRVAHARDLELPAWDPRTALGMAICYATGPTGGDHCKGWTVTGDVDDGPDRLTVKNKAARAWERQVFSSAIDTMGICVFADFMYDYDIWARCLNVMWDGNFTKQDIEEIGKRVFACEREVNTKLGVTKADMTLPERIIGYEVEVDGKKFTLTREMFEEMMEEYWALAR